VSVLVILVEDQLEVLARDTDMYGFELPRLEVGLNVTIQLKVPKTFEQNVCCQRRDQLALAQCTCWIEVLPTCGPWHVCVQLYLSGNLRLVN